MTKQSSSPARTKRPRRQLPEKQKAPRRSTPRRETSSNVQAPLVPGGADRHDRPFAISLLQSDVQVTRTASNAPFRSDVVLPLGTHAAGAHALETARLDLVEQSVQQVRGLVAAEEAALVRETGELQHDLFGAADAGHDRVDVATAEAPLEVRHRRIEVAELSRGDHRYEQQYKSDLRPDFHFICLRDAYRNGPHVVFILAPSMS